MRLLLSTLAWPDGGKPDVRDIDAELTIGRGDESGWKLPDPNSRLSRRHCMLTPYGDAWRVTDLSLNGTFVNDSTEPLGREQSHELHDGDQIRIGAYVIEARYQVSSALRTPSPPRHVPFEASPDNPFVPPEERTARGPSWHAIDPSAPEHGFPGDPDHFVGQPVADHSPAMSDNWQPPPPRSFALPDDFDPATAPPAGEAPHTPSSFQLPDDWDPATAQPIPLMPAATAPPSAAPNAPAVGAPIPADPDASRTGPPTDAQDAIPPTMPLMRGAVAPSDAALFAAFLRGAGMTDAGDADPEALLERVGELTRVVVDRLRALLVDRAAIKREFRILATQVRLEDNNPVRFSASTDAALRSLLTGGRKPNVAVGEVLDGIRLHELAMIAAMRDAVNELLETLNPRHVRGGADDGGLARMLPMQRKARAFDQYEALHAATVRALTDDFDSVFGKAFARAYERVALDEDNAVWRGRQ